MTNKHVLHRQKLEEYFGNDSQSRGFKSYEDEQQSIVTEEKMTKSEPELYFLDFEGLDLEKSNKMIEDIKNRYEKLKKESKEQLTIMEAVPTKFELELRNLINKHSEENKSNTPDFILAKFMNSSLEAFNAATKQRTLWMDHSVRANMKQICKPTSKREESKKFFSEKYESRPERDEIDLNAERIDTELQSIDPNKTIDCVLEDASENWIKLSLKGTFYTGAIIVLKDRIRFIIENYYKMRNPMENVDYYCEYLLTDEGKDLLSYHLDRFVRKLNCTEMAAVKNA